MNRFHGAPRCLGTANRAFTLIEAVISVVLVSVLLVSAMNTLGTSKTIQLIMSDHGRGQQLAYDLMSEILEQEYEEPIDLPSFGVEGSESGPSRSAFDDVDDYHGWTAAPPQLKNGSPIIGYNGWTRSVAVQWIDPNDLQKPASSPKGIKRITVTAARGAGPAATLIAFRTAAWRSTVSDSIAIAGNRPPIASASANPVSIEGGDTVTFDAGASTDPDGDLLVYFWVFGDGTSGSGITINHTYQNTGLYTAILTVSDGQGGIDTDSLTIEVD